jgi:hypothetical protein
MKTTTLITSLLFGATLFSFSPIGQAQPTSELEGRAKNNQYAVKFLCGKAPGPETTGVVAPGQYFTAVNVHNPARTGVGFIKKVALANAWQKPGKVSKFIDGKLGADEAMEVDCRELAKMGGVTPGTLFGGYLVFETRDGTELDIVAVYTAASGPGVASIHTERVPRRQVP